MKALVISADGFEDMELFYPIYRMREAGWAVTLAAPHKAEITGKHGYCVMADTAITSIIAKNYDILVLPGGKAPEKLRKNQEVLAIVNHFFENCKPVAAICHGPQVLISAGVMKGRKSTSWPELKDELVAAGAVYSDAPVVVDGILVTSRMPDDLPEFMQETLRIASKTKERMAA